MNKPRLPGFHPGFPGQQLCDLRNVTNLSGSQFPYLHNAVGVQSPSPVRLFATPWTAARQASLSLTISWSLYKFMSIESVMQSNPLILCCPLLLLPSIFPSIRVFSNESTVPIRWPKYWSFSFSISPSNEYSEMISLLSKGLSRVFSNTTVRKHQFFAALSSLLSPFHIRT